MTAEYRVARFAAQTRSPNGGAGDFLELTTPFGLRLIKNVYENSHVLRVHDI